MQMKHEYTLHQLLKLSFYVENHCLDSGMHALVHTHTHANTHMYTQMKVSGEITSSELYTLYDCI